MGIGADTWAGACVGVVAIWVGAGATGVDAEF